MLKKILSRFRRKSFELSLGEIFGSFESSAFKYNYTSADYLRIAGETYNRNSDFREAVHKITITCLSFPLCLKDEKGMIHELTPKIKEFINNPLANECNWRKFIESCFIQYYISGEIFLLDYPIEKINNTKSNLYLVRPDEVTKVRYLDGLPYEYKVSSSFFKRNGLDVMKNTTFTSEIRNGMYVNDMAHFKNFNPTGDNNHRGLSIAIALLNDIEILVKGRQWNRSVVNNEGRPSGVFFYPPNSSKANNAHGGKFIGKNKVNEEIKQNYAGSGNAGKSLVLSGGLQFKEITYKMKDVDFINGLEFSRKSIANLLGIPLQMFGSEEKSSYNNMTEARQNFHNDTCIPMMDNFLEFLSTEILYKNGDLDEGLKLAVDKEKTDVANTLRMQKMKEYDKMNFLTTNEKREFCGLDKSNDMNSDAILQPTSLIPIDELGMGQENIDDDDPENDENDPPKNNDENDDDE